VSDGQVTTWHHGLVARWWAMFNVDGPEIEFFGRAVASGQPALDVGCGSGRLLVPWLASGYDVDGADASADMIDVCRAAAASQGFQPALYVQATHLLDLPRHYRTAVLCGVLGIGVSQQHDLDGLRRVRAHLLPGGTLLLDYERGEFDAAAMAGWTPQPADDTPPAPEQWRRGPDGDDYALRVRITSVAADRRSVEREMTAWQWHDGALVRTESYRLLVNLYTPDDIVALLGQAGFVDVQVTGGYHGGPPRGDERFLVYTAIAP
jgi:SAM-dependent methyltransferase